jgi:hypothetical protein
MDGNNSNSFSSLLKLTITIETFDNSYTTKF